MDGFVTKIVQAISDPKQSLIDTFSKFTGLRLV